MLRLTRGGPAAEIPACAGPGAARLAVTFRLVLVLRALLMAMALVLTPVAEWTPNLLGAVAVVAAATVLAEVRWRTVLEWLLRHPVLACLDAVLAGSVLAMGGVFGPFFLFTVMTSALAGVLFSWGPVLLVSGAQVALCYVAMAVGPGLPDPGAPGVLIGLPAFYPLTACAGVALRALFDQYAEVEDSRRHVETMLAAAEERARLAREMHDSLAKTLHGIGMSAAVLPVWIRRDPDRAERTARDIVAALGVATREARGLIAELRDDAHVMPLAAAIRRVIAEWGREDGVPVRVTVADESPDRSDPSGAGPLPRTVRYEIVSVLKEALANVRRHAAASAVEVRLSWRDDAVELAVRDDGRGFAMPDGERLDPLARAGHYGLVGMAERARRVGGRLAVWSAPGRGTLVTMTVPVPGAELGARPRPTARSGR
ncbi:sensor histidine kinase [Actinomadura kijaniata]|uniref:sensor histidine kinase n=1 Tax=Actinomadura kijaniata TaxID=46161 RepID=UPI000A06E9AD|nr:ATP-binding protein [Actinomadura kijaniata]